MNLVSDCFMSAAPLTDHSVIKLNIKTPDVSRQNKGYWKLNSSLLKCQSFNEGIGAMVSNVMSDESILSYISKWEFLKFKIREYSIRFEKTLNRSNRLFEMNIIKEINVYYNKTSPTDNEKQKLQSLLNKLDEMYLCKAKGAFIRSRAKWIEDGEKSTSYFCRLEKRRQEKLSVKALLIHGQVITDQASITKEVVNFYSNLYSSTFSLDDTKSFFDHIKDFIPHIDDDFVALCDADITSDELDKAVGSLSLDKSPGCDGLTANFYKHFWSILKEPFVLMLKEAIETSSNKRGSCFEGIRVCFYGVGQP